ncbi:MAG TPA: DUF1565 domain-containing protein, partial [Actinomycetes bacterium]|nr:DUF1565 domain-containing protein [Actinomycetes bacterium]
MLVALTAAALLLPTHSASAAAATLYVGGSGCSNSGPGSESQPFCTISAASSAAVAGQTVQVSSGVYAEAVTVARSGTAAAPIVFTTAPGASATVTGGTFGFKTSSRSWVTIIGFDITQTSGNGIHVSSSSNIDIQGVTVTGTTGHGIYVSN